MLRSCRHGASAIPSGGVRRCTEGQCGYGGSYGRGEGELGRGGGCGAKDVLHFSDRSQRVEVALSFFGASQGQQRKCACFQRVKLWRGGVWTTTRYTNSADDVATSNVTPVRQQSRLDCSSIQSCHYFIISMHCNPYNQISAGPYSIQKALSDTVPI